MSGLIKIFDAIGDIGKVFKSIGELFITIINLFVNGLNIVFEIFTPNKFLNDFVYGTFAAIGLFFNAIFGAISPSNLYNKVTAKIGKKNPEKGVFGMTKPQNADGTYVASAEANDRKCFPPTIARMILMILCPPFALFLHVGLSRWYYVVLCTILTIYGYYFPGLIYAALQILC